VNQKTQFEIDSHARPKRRAKPSHGDHSATFRIGQSAIRIRRNPLNQNQQTFSNRSKIARFRAPFVRHKSQVTIPRPVGPNRYPSTRISTNRFKTNDCTFSNRYFFGLFSSSRSANHKSRFAASPQKQEWRRNPSVAAPF
jgi:hypothetical protein